MRINGNDAAFVVNIRRPEAAAPTAETAKTQGPAATSPAKAAASPDRVVFSAKTREIEKLKQAMEQIPEVRPEKVALAKQRMQSGEYKVDGNAVAQKLMDSLKRAK